MTQTIATVAAVPEAVSPLREAWRQFLRNRPAVGLSLIHISEPTRPY